MTNDYDRPPLPFMERPSKRFFWQKTWSGRIIALNALVFFAVCVISRSIFLPDIATLHTIGAKDPVGLAMGEWWRFFTPIFIHIGIIHFAVNSYMLYQIGFQIESILGSSWFLIIYLSSGIIGNVASALFSPNLSAGASGALFGLLGAGFYLERSIGQRIAEITGHKPRRRVYAMTILLNLAIGLLIPFIDNAAHIGGLIGGAVATAAMMMIRPNRLQEVRKPLGVVILAGLLGITVIGGCVASTKTYAITLILDAAESSNNFEQKFQFARQAHIIDPDNQRLSVLVSSLIEELNDQGYRLDAIEVRRYFERPRSF